VPFELAVQEALRAVVVLTIKGPAVAKRKAGTEPKADISAVCDNNELRNFCIIASPEQADAKVAALK